MFAFTNTFAHSAMNSAQVSVASIVCLIILPAWLSRICATITIKLNSKCVWPQYASLGHPRGSHCVTMDDLMLPMS